MASLCEIVKYTDDFLRIEEVHDWDNALNGLQIENSGTVTSIGAAVDVSTRVLAEAAKRKVNFLLVHHGLFWAGLQPVAGAFRRQLKLALDNDIALYSAHLPLDLHPKVGNNARLASALGVRSVRRFLDVKGQPIGLKARVAMARRELIRRLERALGGPVKLAGRGPETLRAIAIITGGAGSEIYRVARENIDTFITGEAPHWAAVAAEELRINLVLGGHYATEVFGVKALAGHLARRFKIPCTFIDCPTGL